MKTIFGYDTKEARDFGVIVSDELYDVIKHFLIVHKMKHPKDVEFISDPPYNREEKKMSGPDLIDITNDKELMDRVLKKSAEMQEETLKKAEEEE